MLDRQWDSRALRDKGGHWCCCAVKKNNSYVAVQVPPNTWMFWKCSCCCNVTWQSPAAFFICERQTLEETRTQFSGNSSEFNENAPRAEPPSPHYLQFLHVNKAAVITSIPFPLRLNTTVYCTCFVLGIRLCRISQRYYMRHIIWLSSGDFIFKKCIFIGTRGLVFGFTLRKHKLSRGFIFKCSWRKLKFQVNSKERENKFKCKKDAPHCPTVSTHEGSIFPRSIWFLRSWGFERTGRNPHAWMNS